MTANPIPRHIFLADDDIDDRQMFQDALSEVSKTVVLTQVEDGVELMALLNLPPKPLPEIVFLDLNMPRRNGLDCLVEMCANQINNINVIMLTTSENPANIKTAFDLGAAYYAVIPNTFDGLKQLIASALDIDWETRKTLRNRADFVLS